MAVSAFSRYRNDAVGEVVISRCGCAVGQISQLRSHGIRSHATTVLIFFDHRMQNKRWRVDLHTATPACYPYEII